IGAAVLSLAWVKDLSRLVCSGPNTYSVPSRPRPSVQLQAKISGASATLFRRQGVLFHSRDMTPAS
ncbi:hypothetical protein COCMIDRAFT_92199, partial [Bipolaris oryzae ATCC 44560]